MSQVVGYLKGKSAIHIARAYGGKQRNFVGLLAATGLRPGETTALEMGDANLEVGVLSVRESKFGKSREVPIHTSTVAALKHYARR